MLISVVKARTMTGKEKQQKKNEEIRDFVKCHPLPPREDFDFWKSVLDRVVSESNAERFKLFIYTQTT